MSCKVVSNGELLFDVYIPHDGTSTQFLATYGEVYTLVHMTQHTMKVRKGPALYRDHEGAHAQAARLDSVLRPHIAQEVYLKVRKGPALYRDHEGAHAPAARLDSVLRPHIAQ